MIKEIVWIRDFLIDLVNSLISILRLILLSKFFVKLPKLGDSDPNECVILGNGPSLKGSLMEREFFKGKTLMCVNYFARVEEYTLLKPSIYTICSPEYFLDEKKEAYKTERKITFQTMAEQTTWPMFLVVPALAMNRKNWKQEISKNKNITIHYMNTTPIEGFGFFRNYLFGLNLGMPRPHNVLVSSIWLSLNMNFKNIYLAGADHSWLPEVFVSEQNEVLIGQKHFYDDQIEKQDSEVNKPDPKPMYKGASTEKRKLHEVLEKFYLSFKSYWQLKEFAKYKGKNVYNITKGSYIDAFERMDTSK